MKINKQQAAVLSGDVRTVAMAMAVRWSYSAQTHLLELMRELNLRNARGVHFSAAEIRDARELLLKAKLVEEQYMRPDRQCLMPAARLALHAEARRTLGAQAICAALARQAGNGNPFSHHWYPPTDSSLVHALVRAAAFVAREEEFKRLGQSVGMRLNWSEVIQDALLDGLDAATFGELPAHLQYKTACIALDSVCRGWPNYRTLADWLAQQPVDEFFRQMPNARLLLAEWRLAGDDAAAAETCLSGLRGPAIDALRAASLIQAGQWAAGRDAFEAALKAGTQMSGVRKQVFPVSLSWRYPLALLALGDPKSLTAARKFCLAESGSRKPEPVGWGLWAHVIGARLGEQPLEATALGFASHEVTRPTLDTLWKLLLRAWVKDELPPLRDLPVLDDCLSALRERFATAGLHWWVKQADLAGRVLAGQEVTGFFVGGSQEKWRSVLAALTALGDEPAKAGASASAASGESRLLWEVSLGKDGRLKSLTPLEQKRGARGWSKPKEVPLTRLAGNAKLSPWDAKVAQAVRVNRHNKREARLDRAAALQALAGHPAVVMAGDHATLVDVVAGTPQVEVVRDGKGGFTIQVSPDPLAPDAKAPAYFHDEAEAREYHAWRATVVLQDSAQRLRVLSFTPAQKRAAQLLASGVKVPEAAHGELEGALRALAGHFDLHSDTAAAARQVPPEPRLRAELVPAGDGLLLRLIVAPLGEKGPRLMPGRGRARLAAAVGGESIGTERDLPAEQAHLDAVLAQIDFLDPPGARDMVCEWPVEDPEQALAMLEVLSAHASIAALDWPRGKAVRVASVDLRQLQVTIKSERDWLRVSGGVRLDEGRVFALQALMAAAAQHSRFVALGDGAYLALSKSLRERLKSLAAVTDVAGDGLRAPVMSAAWLDEALEGTAAEFDRQFRQRMERLQAAQTRTLAVPAALHAELREYQEAGFSWALRLAQAGFGACLADDMGLGKTVQALAVLLARAAGGPALVVAPTSVCGNWLAEATRFAPSLSVSIYGEGEREAALAGIGPGDVVVVSYTLMQQAGEQFAAVTWHTLIADEAQAVKNALAKRSQALFDIPADFRLALSGTPVENRLAELWSIMHFCNPGLLGTQTRFTERFASPIERGRDREAQRLLRRLIAPFVLRRTKAQVLDDLPPRTELVLSVVPDADEAAHYEALRRHVVSEAEALDEAPAGQARMHILAQLTKLRRAACDPRLVTPDLAYVGAKVRAFSELARELADNGHKALVFSQFVDFLSLLRGPLDAAGIAYQYLDGSTPAPERTRRVAAFQAGEGTLFLISLKAGGFGLNLTAADYVVITDPWWNPAAEDQAMGRAHRMGQQRPVTVYRLVSKGTLEERIVELHHDKRALAEGVLSESGDVAALPSVQELIDLMRG